MNAVMTAGAALMPTYGMLPDAEPYPEDKTACHVASFAAKAAEWSVRAAKGSVSESVNAALEAYSFARDASTRAQKAAVVEDLQEELARLVRVAKRNGWSNATGVAPTVFVGNLDSVRRPDWWKFWLSWTKRRSGSGEKAEDARVTSMPPMTGLYNIQREDDYYEYHYSVAKLPPKRAFAAECEGIAESLRATIRKYLIDRGFPSHNDLLGEIFGRHSIGEFPSDRTMCFFVDHLDAFTPDFVRRLQDEVLAEFPLWRLLAQYSEKSIGVYPTGARWGDQCVRNPIDADSPAYRDWINDAKAYDEERFGPLRRQLQHVRKLIPSVQATAKRQQVALVAVLDRYDPRVGEGHAAWFLQCRSSHDLRPVPECGELRTSAVSDQGDIYPQFSENFRPYTDVEPPYWLVTYLLPSVDVREIVVKASADAMEIKFVVDRIVTDAELRAEQAET